MDKQSIFFSILTGIVAIAIMLMAIKALAAKMRIRTNSDNGLNFTFGLWASSFIISFLLLLRPALTLTENAIEIIIFAEAINTTFLTVMEKISIFIGFTFIGTFFFYYVTSKLIILLYGSRNDAIEIENQNNGYFLIKGVVFILLVYAVLPMFEHFLSWFMPAVETPFYR